MEPSCFYGKRGADSNNRNLNESSDENESSDDDDRDFQLNSEEGSSTDESFDEEYDSTNGEDVSDAGNTDDTGTALPHNDSDSGWGPVRAEQRTFSFAGKEELLIKPTPSGSQNKVTPLDIYQLFVSDDIITHIVTETNKFAAQVIENRRPTRRSRLNQWVPTDAEEIRKFLGIIITMGLVRKPILDLYWLKKEIYDTPFIYKNITRDRYSLLLRFLHFNDNEFLDEDSSRLYKLQPLLEKLTENFRSTYTLDHLSSLTRA